MENKDERMIIFDPLIALLKSKRFMTMIVTALVSIIVSLIPALDTARDSLLLVFVTLGGALVGGYSIEDAASQRANKP